MQQENDRLRARRFQLELERGDRLQRIVDLKAEVHTLEENADAYEIERLTLLQNIADMQQQVEETEVQVAALQGMVALQALPPVQAHPEEQQGLSGLDQTSQAGHCYRLHQTRLRAVVLQWVTRMPENDIKKEGAPRCHLRDECGGPLRSMSSCNAIAL
jgi:hypothetical protein